MDASEILRSIEYFYGMILPKAYNLQYWNKDTISNAFVWAQFCEEIYHKLVNNSGRKTLDDLLQAINFNFNDEKRKLCFEDLRSCTKVLTQAFFENPDIENDLLESIVSEIQSNRLVFDEAVHDAVELDSVCVNLMEVLRSISIVNSDRSVYHEIKAELFLNYLKGTTRQMITEEQVETHLSANLELLCENNDKLLLLLHILIHKVSEFEIEFKELQEFVMNWVLLKLTSDPCCLLSNFLWRLPAPKLRQISINSIAFYSFYCSFLIKHANSMEFDSENDISCWKSKNKADDGVMLTFDEILEHFRCLLSVDDDVGESTKKQIISLVNDPAETFVWKEIFSRIT